MNFKIFFLIIAIFIFTFFSCKNSIPNENDDMGLQDSLSDGRVKRFMVADSGHLPPHEHRNIDYHAAGGNESILILEEPWEEGFILGALLGVLRDHEGFLRMYYEVRGQEENDGKRGVAVAVSKDNGETWEKPRLGNLFPKVIDHAGSNLVDIPYDSEIHQSESRVSGRAFGYHDGLYVMVAGNGDEAYGFTSSDGFHWKKSNYIGSIRTDGAWNIFYDTIQEEWRIYGRIRGRRIWEEILDYDVSEPDKNPNPTTRRGISLSRSKNFIDSPWEEVNTLVMDPQDYWDGWNELDDMGMPTGTAPDFYVGSVFEYFGQYIGFPPVFFQDRSRINPLREERVNDPENFDDVEINRRWDGPIFPVLVLSRDGRDFHIPFKNKPAVNLEPYQRISQEEGTTQPPDKPEVGQLQSTRMVVVDDEIQIYFLHNPHSHYRISVRQTPLQRSIERATIKLDRFASAGPGQEWVSEKVTVPENAKALLLNSEGEVSVRIRDAQPENGQIISGFEYEDSITPSGDSVSNRVRWENRKLSELQGQVIRIEANPHDNGRVYGFGFLE